jgi:hypothetical protein
LPASVQQVATASNPGGNMEGKELRFGPERPSPYERAAQPHALCSPKTRFSRPIADSTIRLRQGVEIAAL